jgi:hypothetical protein
MVAAARRPTEVHAREAVGPVWDAAREKELASYKKHGVYETVHESAVPVGIRVTPMRWVYTWKDTGEAKARLTIRGDCETRHLRKTGQNLPDVDSPTVSRMAARIFFAIAALLGWWVVGFDVPTAILQQESSYAESRRPVFVRPPREVGLPAGHVWRLHKVSYGLADAPRAWFHSFRVFMKSCGGRPVVGDPCVYVFFCPHSGRLCGMVDMHVDDGKMAGEPQWQQHMKHRLAAKYGIESFKERNFKVCGLWIEQDEKEIRVHQTPYAENVEKMPSDRARQREPEQPLAADELTQVQRITGACNWLSTQTRPDLSWSCSAIPGESTVDAIRQANKLVEKTRAGASICLRFPKRAFPIDDIALLMYTDASWANMPNCKSQQGHVFALVSKRELANAAESKDGTICGLIIHWDSKRIQRVVRSTFAGETLSAVNCEDTGVFLAKMLESWLNVQRVEGHVISDCASLVDHMFSLDPSVTEKRLKIDLVGMKQNLDNGDIASFNWGDTRIMLADCLTKLMSTEALEHALATNRVPIVYRGDGIKARGLNQDETSALLQAFAAFVVSTGCRADARNLCRALRQFQSRTDLP